MSNRKLFLLLIIAALMLVWAAAQSRISSVKKVELKGPVYLVQGLDPVDIGSIVIKSAAKTFTLERRAGGFTALEKDGYVAVTQKVNELIAEYLDILTAELFTENTANHRDLGVTEDSAEMVVSFFKRDSTLLTGLLIGKAKEQGGGTYARLIGSDKVYVIYQRPKIQSQAIDYLDKNLIAANWQDIVSVTIEGPDELYTLKSTGQAGQIFLAGLPEDEQLKLNESRAVFAIITDLSFTDVIKESAGQKDMVFDKYYICNLKDSTVYTLKIAQKDDKTFVKCVAKFTDSTAISKKEIRDANDAELAKKELKFLARDRAKKFNERHSGWIYEISNYTAGNLVKELVELVEVKKPQVQADPNLK